MHGTIKKRVSSLTDIPAARAYLARIGARVRSMRSAVIEEREGAYNREVTTINFSKEGAVTVKGIGAADAKPSPHEEAALKEEFAGVEWPKRKLLHHIVRPPDGIKDARPENVFEFREATGEHRILMLQIRVENDEGKSYIPWCYFDDDQWRMAEPDGLLPLYGAERLKDASTVFLHEGARGARHIQWLIDCETEEARKALANHPWGSELSGAIHLGWIGGGPNPHRTDWKTLRGVDRIYIVADRDQPGEAAPARISKLLAEAGVAASIIVVRFPDDQFPVAFDLADPFPEKLFRLDHDKRVYTGPHFSDCCELATWATEVEFQPFAGKGRPPKPVYRLRRCFLESWHVVAKESKPLYVCGSTIYTREGFNVRVRPYSHVANPADLLEQEAEAQVSGLAYEPGRGRAGDVILVEGVRCVNTWSPPNVKAKEGDPGPFLRFLEHLVPDATERHEVAKWAATLIARPAVRMRYGVLLTSTVQGVGKSTLGTILRALVGERNTSTVGEKEIVDSQFNGYLARKTLVICNEIYSGKSWAAYNQLKSEITDEDISVNEKFIPPYSIKNKAHLLLCSNATRPLSMADDDRRFLVPRVTEEAKPKEYWSALYAWLTGEGFAIVAAWAEQFVREHGAVTTGDHAPMTGRKSELIEDSRSSLERRVRDLGDTAMSAARDLEIVFVLDDVLQWLAPHAEGKSIDGPRVRKWFRDVGMAVAEKRLKVDGRLSYVISNRPLGESVSWPDLKPMRRMPHDIEVM